MKVDYGELSTETFQAVWRTVLGLCPGLHPDDIGQEGSGWDDSPVLQAVGAEAIRRRETGEFSDEDLYDAEAQRAGLQREQ